MLNGCHQILSNQLARGNDCAAFCAALESADAVKILENLSCEIRYGLIKVGSKNSIRSLYSDFGKISCETGCTYSCKK